MSVSSVLDLGLDLDKSILNLTYAVNKSNLYIVFTFILKIYAFIHSETFNIASSGRNFISMAQTFLFDAVTWQTMTS